MIWYYIKYNMILLYHQHHHNFNVRFFMDAEVRRFRLIHSSLLTLHNAMHLPLAILIFAVIHT